MRLSKMRNWLIWLLLVFGLPATALAAGTCVISDVTTTQNISSRVPDAETVIVTLVCTADASAHTYPAATIPLTGTSPSGSLLNAYNLTGYILYAVGRTPGATAPTANYTTTITDYRGYAMDNALLTTNGSATAAQWTWISPATAPYPVFPVVRPGPITVQISANSVNSAVITLDLIFRTRP
jgi:hypothetical protein